MSATGANGAARDERQKMLPEDKAEDSRVGKMLASQDYEPTAEDLAYKGWKHLIPFRPASKNPKKLPLIAAGPLNFATCHWATSIIYKAYKTGVTEEDLYDTPWKDSAGYNAQRFEKLWNEELANKGKEKASVARVIMRMIHKRLIIAVFLTFLFSGFAILGPAYFLNNILSSMGTHGQTANKCYNVLMLLMTFSGKSISFAAVYMNSLNTAVRVRGGVLSYVFKKILHQVNQKKSVGELVNLCANDGQRLFDACLMGVFSVGALASIAGAAYSIYLLGPWGILGFVTFFMFLPVQVLLSKVIFNMRRKAIPVTDERVKLMSEIVTAIKLVKMYAWEKSFAKKINDIRTREKEILSKSLMVQSLSSVLPQTVPVFASAFTFLAMTCTNNDLTATQAFVFISLLNALRFSLGVMPYAMKALAEGRHACDRMKELLIAEDEKMEVCHIKDSNNLVEIVNGYFGWDAQPEAENGNKPGKGKQKPASNGTAKNGAVKGGNKQSLIESELEPLGVERDDIVVTLQDITMSLPQGRLLGVCGAVGSGKTSLIQAILGMMKKTGGTIAVDGKKKIAYVPQQAWIMNATVRENITFGVEFEQERYDKVVEACALLGDFTQLTAGDQTEIGERGINLSGGQKQRISVARAVYGDADLILLDDPLSAVDAHVGQHIFSNCLKGFLKEKTILFVTHQLQFLTGCDYILVMKDGRINEEGTHEVLMADESSEYASLIKSFHDAQENEKAKDTDAASVVDSLFARQHSKLSAEGRDEFNCKPRSRHTTVTDGNDNMSNSVQELSAGEEFRNRALSMQSVKSARSALSKGLAEARSLKMVDATVGADGLPVGSMVDLSSMTDQEEITPIFPENTEVKKDSIGAGKLTAAEDMEKGAVRMSTYTEYMKAAGGACIVFIVFFSVALSVGSQAFTNYWLSFWLNDGSGMKPNMSMDGNMTSNNLPASDNLLLNPKLNFYQAVYGCSLIAVVIFAIIKSVTYIRTSLVASSRLHDKVFRKLVASPMSFFDVTPSGRIMNRFSKDMDEIDVNLPFMAEQFLNNAFVMVVTVIIIATVFYYFLLAMVPILIMFALIYSICARGIRGMKRVENVTRSPLFSHVATTVQGLGTIRAYKKEEQFHREFNRLQDRNNMALFLFQTAMRWAAVRLDTLSLLVVLATSLFVTFMPSDVIKPAYAALALSYAMNVTGLFQYTMRLAIETEARFTSVERIQTYIKNLVSEAPAVVETSRPDSNWPKEGAVKFTDVEMRYRDGLPLVLKGISMDIKAQEKIGIVGRTGSGKSSIGMAIFRMMELSGGSICIDDVDISTIGLEDLRSKLSIIPQDPVLFVGTVRYNLDPFHAYTDDELWSALAQCHVKHTIKALEGQLDAPIVENGENFSVGERQLLCMARALLRHSKILLLDEATAAIDTETDALIQQTIKEVFADCTMLTIAHRLNTVASSDRILVLDDGQVIEFESPAKLLADPNSVFAQMMAVQESQKQQAMESGAKTN